MCNMIIVPHRPITRIRSRKYLYDLGHLDQEEENLLIKKLRASVNKRLKENIFFEGPLVRLGLWKF